MNGIINVYKPKGITSRDVVNKLNKILNIKKIGHNGTLDPMAKGVLVITLGKYTKLNNLLSSKTKEYIAEVTLGIKTDSLDITGNILKENNDTITKEKLKEVIRNFPKTYMQEVPLFSAVKVNGKRLYEYARNNIDVKLPKKEVNIYSLELLEFNENKFKIKASVSKGTYIRSLIRDLLDKANVIGTMSDLIRTKQGNFDISSSYTLNDIENNNYQILKIKDVSNINTKEVTPDEKNKIVNGVKLKGDYGQQVLFTYNNEELAIYKKDNDVYKVDVMLHENI